MWNVLFVQILIYTIYNYIIDFEPNTGLAIKSYVTVTSYLMLSRWYGFTLKCIWSKPFITVQLVYSGYHNKNCAILWICKRHNNMKLHLNVSSHFGGAILRNN